MACYSPQKAYRAPPSPEKPNGGIVYDPKKGYGDRMLTLPCGQCIGCRLENSRQWAIRCVHENQMHLESCFITLTYDDQFLPYGETLVKSHMQDFMKRLRNKTPKIRQLYCGEYGETTERPHYHALIFGWRPSDGVLLTRDDPPLYESKTLTDTWGKGICSFGDVTFESAAYCARYTTKKITGEKQKEYYEWEDPETGEIIDRVVPFLEPSRRPGIGIPFLEKYGKDIYEKDQVIMRGMPMRPPRAYDKWAEINLPELWRDVRRTRNRQAERYLPVNQDPDETYENSFQHYRARIAIAHAKIRERNELR